MGLIHYFDATESSAAAILQGCSCHKPSCLTSRNRTGNDNREIKETETSTTGTTLLLLLLQSLFMNKHALSFKKMK